MHIVAVLSCVLVSGFSAKAFQTDTSSFAALDGMLDGYLQAMRPLTVQEQQEECDFLISSCSDSLVRQHVALKLYGSYMTSDIMGVEAVAIHIADRWFLTGEVRMKNDIDLMNARIYAEFNRQSLVGMKAPPLDLYRIDGTAESLFGNTGERCSVLYFFDTGCPECLAQSILMRRMLEDEDVRADVYAVYVGTDSLKWRQYVSERLNIKKEGISVHNLWDPECSSTFQRKYGVLQTPGIFLIDRSNVIIGRGLDAVSLMQMLKNEMAVEDYRYGGEESDAVFAEYFMALGPDFKSSDVDSLASHIQEKTGADMIAFKHLTGDLMYWLSCQRDGRYREGCLRLIDGSILSRPDIWNMPEDTLEVVDYAMMMRDLLSRARPGTTIAGVEVRARMRRHGTDCGRQRKWHLDRLPEGTCVIFYSPSCQLCRESLERAGAMSRADRKMRFLLVNIDEAGPDVNLQDIFDLSMLPYITILGRGGRVLARYVDFLSASFGDAGK